MNSTVMYENIMTLVELICTCPSSLTVTSCEEDGVETYVTTCQLNEQLKKALNNKGDIGHAWTLEKEDSLEELVSLAAQIAIGKLGPSGRLDEDHMTLFLDLTARATKNDRPKQALDILESLKMFCQDGAPEGFFYNLDKAQLGLNKFEEANENLKQSLNMLKLKATESGQLHWASTHFNLGQSFLFQGKYMEAIEHFEESIKIYKDTGTLAPHAAKIFMKLGKSYFELGENGKAIDYLSKCLELDLANPDKANKDAILAKDYNYMGDLCFGKNEYEQASVWYKKSLDLQTKSFFISWLMCKLGKSYAQLDRDDEAVKYLEGGLRQADLSDKNGENEPRFLYSLKSLTMCYRRLSMVTEARTMLEPVIARDDTHEEIKMHARVALRSLN